MKKPPLLAFVGESGSGKTTLVEKLISTLTEEGFSVGAVKRSHHKIDIDREGKDSDRFSKAGANPTVVATDSFVCYMEKTDRPPELESIAENFAGKADIVLVEGFKTEPVTKFLFLDKKPHSSKIVSDDPHIAGFITNGIPEKTFSRNGTPIFKRDDIKGVAGWIKNWIAKQNEAE